MKRKGFTLIEVIIVLAVIGILLKIGVFNSQNTLVSARMAMIQSARSSFIKQLNFCLTQALANNGAKVTLLSQNDLQEDSFDIEFVVDSTVAYGYRITRAGSTNIDTLGGYGCVFLFSALTNTANNWKYLAASNDPPNANNSLWVASTSLTTCTFTLRAINKSFSFNFITNKVSDIQ